MPGTVKDVFVFKPYRFVCTAAPTLPERTHRQYAAAAVTAPNALGWIYSSPDIRFHGCGIVSHVRSLALLGFASKAAPQKLGQPKYNLAFGQTVSDGTLRLIIGLP
jgi:hypothetical protein